MVGCESAGVGGISIQYLHPHPHAQSSYCHCQFNVCCNCKTFRKHSRTNEYTEKIFSSESNNLKMISLQQHNISSVSRENDCFVLWCALKRKNPVSDSCGESHKCKVIHAAVEKKECHDDAHFLAFLFVFF